MNQGKEENRSQKKKKKSREKSTWWRAGRAGVLGMVSFVGWSIATASCGLRIAIDSLPEGEI